MFFQDANLFLVVIVHLFAQTLASVHHILIPSVHLDLVLHLGDFSAEIYALILEGFFGFCHFLQLLLADCQPRTKVLDLALKKAVVAVDLWLF